MASSASMEDTATREAQREPHVLLYFDVNKTLIMHDPVQGKALPHILNDLLTERAFGRVEHSSEADTDSSWVWNGQKALGGFGHKQPAADEVSYGAFLRAKFPLSSDVHVAKHNKHMRKVLRQDFTSPGNAGEGLASEHEELLRQLQLPAVPAGDAERVEQAGLAASPYYFIVPAFFRLLQHLQSQQVRFNLIFRTFGDDLHRIAQEFNCFCEGLHPFFPLEKPMDGSDGGVDRRISLEPSSPSSKTPRFGTFLRAQGLTALVMGTFEQPTAAEALVEHPLGFYASKDVQIVRGLDSIHAFLTENWRESQATLALRDFYPFWFHNKEEATAGKLLPLDAPESAVHAMFFDDNILAHDAHIVDARLARDGSPLAFDDTRELNLLRVEPLEVIRSDSYFVRRFQESMQRWRRAQQ